jgi:hypothetical protein
MPRRFNTDSLLFLALILVLGHAACHSRGLRSGSRAAKDTLELFPYWIAMMDSPGVNYARAVEAFDKYWEHREKPTGEDGEARDIYGKEKTDKEREKESGRSVAYVYEYKRFLNWKERNKNLVKPDGTVMSAEELLEQWKNARNDTIQR